MLRADTDKLNNGIEIGLVVVVLLQVLVGFFSEEN